MGKEIRLTNDFSIDMLKAEFHAVNESLVKLESDFYRPILAIPSVSPEDLPLILRSESGAQDIYSRNIHYFFYPWLFIDAFPGIKQADLDELCRISQLFAESLVQLDKVIDHQLDDRPEVMRTLMLAGSQFKFASGVRRLSWLFGGDSPFWETYDRLFSEHVCQIFREKTNRSFELPSLREMERDASNKVAMTKIITAAMGELTGKKDALPMLEASQDLFSTGYQLYDDVKDWRQDYESGQYSYLLKRAFNELGISDAIARGECLDPTRLGQRIHLSEIIPDTLQLAVDYMERAKGAVSSIDCPKWAWWIETHQASIRTLRADMMGIRDRAIERARLKSIPTVGIAKDQPGPADGAGCADALSLGLAFLQEQERKDYLEARHLDIGGKAQGDRSVLHCGVVFQRAITLHTLALARQSGLAIDGTAFSRDLQALIGSRPNNRIGGWNYFPDIADLPPDCDDLAEVLIVLVNASYPEISTLCDGIIELALRGQKTDGSIGTWIASPDDRDSLRSRDNMHRIWGAQPDTEVMANFLYALWAYDRRRFADPIRAGAEFIAGRQDPEGFWSSTWYPGPYYGTWACCRLLRAIGGYDGSLRAAGRFIRKARRENGMWGEDPEAVLNTAYAVMTLVDCLDEGDPDIVWPAARRMMGLQRVNGSWKGSSFIKMRPISKEAMSQPGYREYYESDTVSTAFAVRSLLSVRRRYG